MIEIKLKRAYDEPAGGDGFRILVDRLWPRGISKERLQLDVWAKDLAPSTELRKWFGHDPARWAEFVTRYRAALKQSGAADAIAALLVSAKRSKTITLIYGAKDREHNEAVILQRLFARKAGLTAKKAADRPPR
jgi:uncharacterized protein YeaO (DUF488 family)